ncbi:hypothetical protein N2605_15380 [Bradyrhizobium yuanmingense]|uniref:hypothetical protein n=1 Tax=Bradyrhizobium yuanmingense TaxID=108015 RepID=UPI0021A45688|nr:hypothetical protein [Bradyrhizobium sp. CB1024]UWU87762.1 hypothetical protein N2605_15380 [Bradyrhizobium sp. CB1024]
MSENKSVHLLRDEARDLVRPLHVIGVVERDGGGIALRRDPFGVFGEECRDALGIAGRKGLPGVQYDVSRAGHDGVSGRVAMRTAF